MISVVITGPESTGKSVLTQQLAKHFNGFGVKEYARRYVENLKRPYTLHDVEVIAQRQIEEYNIMKAKAGERQLVFFDTFLIITKVWFEEVFQICPQWLHHALKNMHIDFALLCYPDLPWVPDGVRENPDKRAYLYQRYLEELEFYNIPYRIVKGEGEKRTERAINYVNKLKI